jgi:hypothetical protein
VTTLATGGPPDISMLGNARTSYRGVGVIGLIVTRLLLLDQGPTGVLQVLIDYRK